MKTMRKPIIKKIVFQPAAWQWDPANISGARPDSTHVQFWSSRGSMSLVTIAEAKALVAERAAFVGSVVHICQVAQ